MTQPGLYLGLLLIIVTMCSPAQSDNTANLEARRKELNRLIADEWEYEMRESPQTATTIGDYRYNDKWDDASLAYVSKQREDLRKWLARFESVDVTGFPEQEKLSHAMMVRNLKERV